jgi:mono/diheme cytochrome c family protein
MIGAITAGLVAFAVGLFVLWVILYAAGLVRPRISVDSDAVSGAPAMERKVLLSTGMVLATGVLLTIYGFWDPIRQAGAKERQLDTSISRGVENFTTLCYSCHGEDGKGAVVPDSDPPRVAPQLNRDQFWTKDPDEAKKQYDLVYKTIQRGRPGTPMPAWGQTDGGTLNQEQIHELASMIVNGDRHINMTTFVQEEHDGHTTTLPRALAGTPWDLSVEICAEHNPPCKTLKPDDPEVLARQGPPELQAGIKLFSANGCVACHATKGDQRLVGPSLANISQTGATRKPGTSAEDYIKESIRNPQAYVVPGFGPPSPMPAFPPNQISDADLENLVKYLMSLK